MPQTATPSGILEWLTRSARPRSSDAATLRFERMDSQAAHGLPEIHIPLDHREPAHWHHRGLIWDYILSMGDAERVLDVGPGDGWPSLLLAPHFKEVIGIEPGPRRVEVCRENARRLRARKVHFEQMAAGALSFKAASFGGVVAATSLEQTPDPAEALKEIHRVLVTGGALRMSYETLENAAEPVREAVLVQRGPEEGVYLIDYDVLWTSAFEQRSYLITVAPATEAGRKRLDLWVERCAADAWPVRDPRLERGLASTIKALREAEVRGAESYRIKHFKTDALIKLLQRIGFQDVRCIAGGGAPAAALARELLHERRIEAAAPVMDELCCGAARFGIGCETTRPGQILARKGRARTAAAKRKAGPAAGEAEAS